VLLAAYFNLIEDKEKSDYNVRIGWPPSFKKGGVNTFRNWVASWLVYPNDLGSQGIEGYVITQFVIKIDGKISEIEIIKSNHPLFSTEALRVLHSSPKWEPAMQNGKPANQQVTMQLDFRLADSPSSNLNNIGIGKYGIGN
jgi:protein TonB